MSPPGTPPRYRIPHSMGCTREPSALAGLTEQYDQQLEDALGITTIAQLGSNKYFALADALVALSSKVG